MPFMYPTDLAAKTIHKAHPWLPASVCKEAVMAYAHAYRDGASESVSDLDVTRIKWIMGVYLTKSELANDAVESVLDQHFS